MLCIAIVILVYALNLREPRGRNGTNHKHKSCCSGLGFLPKFITIHQDDNRDAKNCTSKCALRACKRSQWNFRGMVRTLVTAFLGVHNSVSQSSTQQDSDGQGFDLCQVVLMLHFFFNWSKDFVWSWSSLPFHGLPSKFYFSNCFIDTYTCFARA